MTKYKITINIIQFIGLRYIHLHINTYVATLSKIYDGFEQLKTDNMYTEFTAYEGMSIDTFGKLLIL